jgi:hypothetical protein
MGSMGARRIREGSRASKEGTMADVQPVPSCE